MTATLYIEGLEVHVVTVTDYDIHITKVPNEVVFEPITLEGALASTGAIEVSPICAGTRYIELQANINNLYIKEKPLKHFLTKESKHKDRFGVYKKRKFR